MNGKMHIGLFCSSLPDREAPSGIATYVAVMRKALREVGHRVTVVTFSESQQDDAPPRPTAASPSWPNRITPHLHFFRSKIGDSPGAGAKLAAHFAALHDRDPFDIVEMEESFGWAATVAKALPIPVVTRLHGPHLYGRDTIETQAAHKISELRIVIEGQSIARAPALTSPSARLLAATLGDYDLRPQLATVIPNPIALAPADMCWSIDRCDPYQILHLGRFDTRKGADISIAAFALALRTHPKLRLVIAGPDRGVITADGGLAHFSTYVRDHVDESVSARISFTGSVSKSEVVALRRQSAVSLVPSRFENFAYSIAEAMAIGAPTIASDSFGNTEMIADGLTGKIVPVGDVGATAAALVWMIEHPSEAAAMGARLRERCADWLDPATVAHQTVDFYKTVISGWRH